ncbi:MAG: Hg(II)-responsive transcriptional regulator [Acidobacteria bacterium]|nr:Hg(II)-responsive transcriptional regulator [Acidobacteriota bacterium]
MKKTLTIGRVAELAGVNVETVRYYQRRGLLQEPKKPSAGYRQYGPETVDRLRFIKRAQALGFTLEESSELLRFEKACACAETRTLAAHKLELIDEKVRALSAMRNVLGDLIQRCDVEESKDGCPIIQALSRDAAA